MEKHDIQLAQQKPLANYLVQVDEAVSLFLKSQHANNSRRAYISDCKQFSTWCLSHDLEALPASPETLARYLSAMAISGLSARTISRRRAAIKWMHENGDHNSPTSHPLVKRTMQGIMREVGNAMRDQKAPIIADQLASMIAHVDTSTLAGLRDKALLVIGFAGAFRRSELTQIKIEHLKFQQKGVTVYLPKSKTDQNGEGRYVPILNGQRFNSTGVLSDYLEKLGVRHGFLFRAVSKAGNAKETALSDKTVSDTVKKYAALAGINPKEVSGHSLRAGFVTTGVMHDANIFKIMDVTGHKEIKTVRIYARIAEQFKDHAGDGFL